MTSAAFSFIGLLKLKTPTKNVLRPEDQGPEGYGPTHCILSMQNEILYAVFNVIRVAPCKNVFIRGPVFTFMYECHVFTRRKITLIHLRGPVVLGFQFDKLQWRIPA